MDFRCQAPTWCLCGPTGDLRLDWLLWLLGRVGFLADQLPFDRMIAGSYFGEEASSCVPISMFAGPLPNGVLPYLFTALDPMPARAHGCRTGSEGLNRQRQSGIAFRRDWGKSTSNQGEVGPGSQVRLPASRSDSELVGPPGYVVTVLRRERARARLPLRSDPSQHSAELYHRLSHTAGGRAETCPSRPNRLSWERIW